MNHLNMHLIPHKSKKYLKTVFFLGRSFAKRKGESKEICNRVLEYDKIKNEKYGKVLEIGVTENEGTRV